ncbi:DUF4030 domain-containing protein [Niallia circulans]|nr:DUF4030 domain-containing protein [Niallia circulans]
MKKEAAQEIIRSINQFFHSEEINQMIHNDSYNITVYSEEKKKIKID